MLRFIVAALAAALALLGPAPAAATVFGQFEGARTLPVNAHLFGAYLRASDDVVGLAAQLRMSFYPGVDFGFQGALSRLDYEGGDRSTVGLGADFKARVANAGESLPFDLALGGSMGLESGDDFSILSIGPTAVASRTFAYGQSGTVTPYLGVRLAFSQIEVRPIDRTDLSLPLRLGAETSLMPELKITTELQLRLSDEFNDNAAFAVGVHLPF